MEIIEVTDIEKDLLLNIRKATNNNERITILTEQEVAYLREMIKDRQAASRVFSKWKMFLITGAALIGSWMIFYDNIIVHLKKWIAG